MFNVQNLLYAVPFQSFSYWFMRYAGSTFIIYQKDPVTGVFTRIGLIKDHVTGDDTILFDDDNTSVDLKVDIEKDFKNFRGRPEYTVGTKSESSIVDIASQYNMELLGCILIRTFRACIVHQEFVNIDSYTKPVQSAVDWLQTTDFYTAPASTRYHDNVATGLVTHTMKVVDKIVDLFKTDVFSKGTTLESAVLVALLHDWCKIGFYESYMRNVKDENGKWYQKAEYTYREKSLTCFGHAVSSLFLAQKFFKLTTEEALAIRWHMGYCRVSDEEKFELQQANDTYPIVHLLQFADQLSIVDY